MILNLTQHNATKDQQDAGIIDMPVEFQVALKGLLTFPTQYTRADLEYRALQIHELVCDTVKVGSKNLDVTVTYATDTCTSPYSYIIADVKPFCNKYNSIIDKRFNTTDELVEAVKQLT